MLVKPSALSPDAVPPAAAAPTGDRPARDLALRTSKQGPLEVLHMDGVLDAETAVTAEAQILSTIVLTREPLHLVLDLGGLTGIDAAGIALLAKARFAVRAARGTLHIVAPAGSAAHFALRTGVPRTAPGPVEDIADIRLGDGTGAPDAPA
ncbi:STAS domain-containing protein [Actinomadura rifamycini]|uniref:STAS domain-containing protein n=1 Tax=Actinomadura rifamycini TaxID=31962 RepID=UPI000419B1F4|nr:STAS domain-containing protein [Actinomadura rifamycini]